VKQMSKCKHEKLLRENQTPLDTDGDYYCPKCGMRFAVFEATTLTRTDKLVDGTTFWTRKPRKEK